MPAATMSEPTGTRNGMAAPFSENSRGTAVPHSGTCDHGIQEQSTRPRPVRCRQWRGRGRGALLGRFACDRSQPDRSMAGGIRRDPGVRDEPCAWRTRRGPPMPDGSVQLNARGRTVVSNRRGWTLGHANIKTTDTYLNVTRIGLRDSMQRYDDFRKSCTTVAQDRLDESLEGLEDDAIEGTEILVPSDLVVGGVDGTRTR